MSGTWRRLTGGPTGRWSVWKFNWLANHKLIAVIEQPIPGLPDDHLLSASIGICLFPRENGPNTPEAVIRCADLAMYRAKARGKRCCHFWEA